MRSTFAAWAVAELLSLGKEAMNSPPPIPSARVQKKPSPANEILLCVFGLLTAVAHFASPLAIVLIATALFFWSRRKDGKTWYGTVGLVVAFISLGCTVVYLAIALLGWLLKAAR